MSIKKNHFIFIFAILIAAFILSIFHQIISDHVIIGRDGGFFNNLDPLQIFYTTSFLSSAYGFLCFGRKIIYYFTFVISSFICLTLIEFLYIFVYISLSYGSYSDFSNEWAGFMLWLYILPFFTISGIVYLVGRGLLALIRPTKRF